jgi:hypothetical protein
MCKNNTKTNQINCSICKKSIEPNKLGYNLGHNPHPLMKKDSDRCCNDCNIIYVMPIRILMLGLTNNPMYKKMVNEKGWLKNIEGSMNLVRFSFIKL